MELAEYQDKFSCIEVSRDDSGILTVRLHSRGGPLMWSGRPHRELSELWAAVASDRDNRVVVLTGTGETFIGVKDFVTLTDALVRGEVGPRDWDHAMFEGLRLINQMLAVEVPVICALNGPADAHSELAVLSDVVIAAEHAYFQDIPHAPCGLVPGDGMQIIWPLLLGPNRGRYFLLTGQRIDAREAHRLGIVGEVLPAEQVLSRAYEIAREISKRNPVMMRNTRHVFVRPLRRAISEDLHYGLAMECIGALSGVEFAAPKQATHVAQGQ